jgi:hypothetical protein
MTYFSGLRDFINSWDDPFVETHPDEVFRQSPQGHINADGTAVCGDSPIFSKYHRYFKRSIEVGVKDLTVALIRKFDCITYSSCQGHRSTFNAVMRPRYVGILPRNQDEFQRLLLSLQLLVNLVNSHFPHSPVVLTLGQDLVESEDLNLPGLTVFFEPVTPDEDVYFQIVDEIYNYLLLLINS